MIKATLQDKTTVINILHSAFEPITIANSINFVVKQDAKRSERLTVLFEYLFYSALYYGDIYLSDNKKACLLIDYPHLKTYRFKLLKHQFNLVFKGIGLANLPKVLRRERLLKKHHYNIPHIHPLILATYRKDRGKAYAYTLIKEVLNTTENHLPIIIETTTLENIKLYEHFGFKTIKTVNTLDYPLIFLKK